MCPRVKRLKKSCAGSHNSIRRRAYRGATLWPTSSNTGRRLTNYVSRAPGNLPFVGSSHEFVGAEQGNTNVSVFLYHGKPGSGPGPHWHPYDEIQFIREGRGVWTVSGKTFEGSAGDIFVIKTGEIHSFKVIGDSPLVQLDIHLSSRFIQENL